MNIHNQWLFDTPSMPASRNYANPEYEVPLENEWEMELSNYENSSLAEDEWEARPTRRATSRASRSISRSARPVGRTVRAPQRRTAVSRRQPQRTSVAQRQLRQPAPNPQGTGTGAEPQILIATIDRFEFRSYLFKRHQFEQLHDLLLVLNDNKELLPNLQLTFRGHTDNVGGESVSNFHLAARRAMEVESFVKRRFFKIVPNLVTAIHTASSKEPIAPNTTKDGQARNRRVEVFSNIPLKPAK